MAAPAFRSVDSVAGNPRTTISPNKPVGVVTNDVLVAFIIVETTENPITGLTPPAGWTLELDTFSAIVGGQEGHLLCYSKLALSEPAFWEWSWTNSHWSEAVVLAYSGCRTVNYRDIVSASPAVNNSTITWSGTTTLNESTLVFGARNGNGGAGNFTGPGNERYDGATDELSAFDDAGPVSAGPTGIKTFTGGVGEYQVIGIAIVPTQPSDVGSFPTARIRSRRTSW